MRYKVLQFKPMKLNKTQTDLKTRLEKLGYRVYFKDDKVRLSYPTYARGCETLTFREAYNKAKDETGKGKSVRQYMKHVKEISTGVIRAHVRDQIHKGLDDIHYSPKSACDPWKYD